MIVPQFWAEARLQHRERKRQVTVRRFGWSDASQADAQRHADDRARDALARILAGERIERRDHKIPYNGAEGLPIREEIVSRHGDAVITRNSYGALCLNTENVLFADVDFGESVPGRWVGTTFAGLFVAMVVVGISTGSWRVAGSIALASVFFGYLLAGLLFRIVTVLRGGAEAWARSRIRRFANAHPEWHLRLYRTPAGFRVLAMHRTFDPAETAVDEFFRAIRADRIYRHMCRNQKCFRARLTPKPWRIGISDHVRPRPGVWPVNPDRLPERRRWLDEYDRLSKNYAACRFIEAIGSSEVDAKAEAVRRMHDDMCRVEASLDLA